jgi:hypothetical protein
MSKVVEALIEYNNNGKIEMPNNMENIYLFIKQYLKNKDGSPINDANIRKRKSLDKNKFTSFYNVNVCECL